jgi:hypothetical protein
MAYPRFSKTGVIDEIERRVKLIKAEEAQETWEKDLNRGTVLGLESLLREIQAAKGLSRKTAGRILQSQIDRIQRIWGFDPTNGYAQVQDRKGETHMWEGYGNYRACLDLAEELQIPLLRQGQDMRPLQRRGVLQYVPKRLTTT